MTETVPFGHACQMEIQISLPFLQSNHKIFSGCMLNSERYFIMGTINSLIRLWMHRLSWDFVGCTCQMVCFFSGSCIVELIRSASTRCFLWVHTCCHGKMWKKKNGPFWLKKSPYLELCSWVTNKQNSPAGTQHQNDVVSTSMRRDHVASTLIRRHFNVVCLLGVIQIIFYIHFHNCKSGDNSVIFW